MIPADRPFDPWEPFPYCPCGRTMRGGFCVAHGSTPRLYRGHIIYFSIGAPGYDWRWEHTDFDGGPERAGEGPADDRCGIGASVADCRRQIDERLPEPLCDSCGRWTDPDILADGECPTCRALLTALEV